MCAVGGADGGGGDDGDVDGVGGDDGDDGVVHVDGEGDVHNDDCDVDDDWRWR